MLRFLLAVLHLLVGANSGHTTRPAAAPPADFSPLCDGTAGDQVDDTDVPGEGEPSCKAAGGHCVAVSDCAKGKGSLGVPSCGAAHIVCCMTNCPEETFTCCDQGQPPGASFRPLCRGGKLECREGQHRCDE